MEWLSETTELLATVCENVIILWFLTSFFGTKYDEYKKIIAFIAAVVITTVFTSLFSFAFPNEFLACTFGFIIILAVYCRLCLKGTVWCHILLPVMSETVLMLVAVSINALSVYFTPLTSADAINDKSVMRILILFISKLILFALLGLILLLTKRNRSELRQNEWIAFSAVFAATLVSGVCIYESELNEEKGIMFFILPVAGLIIINVVSFYMLVRISREHKENIKKSMLLVQINEQEKNLQEIHVVYKEVRMIRHNISGQLSTLKELITNGKYEQAECFLNSVEIPDLSTKTANVTNNDMLNAILGFLSRKCAGSDAVLHISILSSDISGFSPADISVILTNLVTNALEACIESADREIKLELFIQRNYYCIKVVNAIKGSVLSDNPKLATTKQDKTVHGFGVESVKMLAEKYNGITSFTESGGYFTAEVWLKLPMNEDDNSNINDNIQHTGID